MFLICFDVVFNFNFFLVSVQLNCLHQKLIQSLNFIFVFVKISFLKNINFTVTCGNSWKLIFGIKEDGFETNDIILFKNIKNMTFPILMDFNFNLTLSNKYNTIANISSWDNLNIFQIVLFFHMKLHRVHNNLVWSFSIFFLRHIVLFEVILIFDPFNLFEQLKFVFP
jgi:hypothetical protein